MLQGGVELASGDLLADISYGKAPDLHHFRSGISLLPSMIFPTFNFYHSSIYDTMSQDQQEKLKNGVIELFNLGMNKGKSDGSYKDGIPKWITEKDIHKVFPGSIRFSFTFDEVHYDDLTFIEMWNEIGKDFIQDLHHFNEQIQDVKKNGYIALVRDSFFEIYLEDAQKFVKTYAAIRILIERDPGKVKEILDPSYKKEYTKDLIDKVMEFIYIFELSELKSLFLRFDLDYNEFIEDLKKWGIL